MSQFFSGTGSGSCFSCRCTWILKFINLLHSVLLKFITAYGDKGHLADVGASHQDNRSHSNKASFIFSSSPVKKRQMFFVEFLLVHIIIQEYRTCLGSKYENS